MENFLDDLKTNTIEHSVHFWGVVEDNVDPMNLGRVKVRCFHYHTDDTSLIPTEALPWALVLQPTTSAAISGIGESPNGLENGSWVYGFFMDGRDAQYPVVTHSVPGIHRPEMAGQPSGTSTGFLAQGNYDSGDSADTTQSFTPMYHQGISSDGVVDDVPTNPAAQGDGSITAVGDINMYLQPKDASRWSQLGLSIYSWKAAPDGLACKDGMGSLRFHYGTALALEKLTKNWGKGKFALTSAYRTPAYNARLSGAAKNSMHTQGRAIDIPFSAIGGGSNANLAAFGAAAVKCGFVGFGIYNTFIHIDTGNGRTWLRAKESWFINAIKGAGWYPGKKGLADIKTTPGSSNAEAPSEQTPDNAKVTATGENQNKMYDYTKNKMGLTDTQSAAVMASAKAESSFNPGSYNPNDVGKPAQGLFQWRGSRQTSLQQFTGTANPSFEQQMDYFNYEMTQDPYYKKIGDQLRAATTPEEANAAMAKYEAYKGYDDPSSAQYQGRLADTYGFLGQGVPTGSPRGYQDPTNSLPTPEYRGEPSTNMNARGFNSYSNQRRILTKDTGRMTGFPAAGDVGTFGEPELQAAPQYPYNHVKSSRSGHMIELDDTPNAERVNIEHKSGSGIEMFADGSVSERSSGNKFNMTNGDEYQGVMGKYFLTSVNDMHIRSTADMNVQSDGAMNITMGNDGSLMISGDYLISVGDEFKVRASKIVFESTGDIDILAKGNLNLEGRAGVTIKSDAKIQMEGKGNITMKAPEVWSDDIMRVGEGKAESVKGADSSDIGAPPERKVVEKNNLKDTANKKGSVTTEEAYQHYAEGREKV